MIGKTNSGGSGHQWNSATIHVYAPEGSEVFATKGTKRIPAREHKVTGADSEYLIFIKYADYGEWTVTATRSGKQTQKQITVSSNIEYTVRLVYAYYLYNKGAWAGATSLSLKNLKYNSSSTVSQGNPSVSYGETEMTIMGNSTSSFLQGVAYFAETIDISNEDFQYLVFKGTFHSRTGTSIANAEFDIWSPAQGTYVTTNRVAYHSMVVGGDETEVRIPLSDITDKSHLLVGFYVNGSNAAASTKLIVSEVFFE